MVVAAAKSIRQAAASARPRPAMAETPRVSPAVRELARARQIRTAAEEYRKQVELRARYQAHQVVLDARLAVRKEIAELKRQSQEEIRCLLADVAMLRDAALAELEAQRKLGDAARIMSLSLSLQENNGAAVMKPEGTASAVTPKIPDNLLAFLEAAPQGESCQLPARK